MTPLWYFFCFSPAENPSSPSTSLCNKWERQLKVTQNEYFRSICSYILDHAQSSFLQMRSQSLTDGHAFSCKKLPVHTTQLSLHVSTRGQQTATTHKTSNERIKPHPLQKRPFFSLLITKTALTPLWIQIQIWWRPCS